MGIDGGTESIRIGIFDINGKMVYRSLKPYPTYFPKPTWAEQNPKDWWLAWKRAVKETLDGSGINPKEIAGISADATSCTVVFLDNQGESIRPAILWMDQRASRQAKMIQKTNHPSLRYVGGGNLSPEWMPCKVLWVKDNEPEVYRRSVKIGEYLDWLLYQLTGKWTASINNTSVRWFYDHSRGGWPREFYREIALSEVFEKFPLRVLRIGEIVGKLSPIIAKEFGLPSGIPVGEGAADGMISLLGVKAINPGTLSMATGSSHCIVGLCKKELHAQGIFGSFPEAIIPNFHIVEVGQTSTGSIIKWFKENFLFKFNVKCTKEDVYQLLEKRAEDIEPGSEGLLVLDHWQGNRTPYIDPNSRGVILGLSLAHTAHHIFRAILEGVAYGTALNIKKIREDLEIKAIHACGGATKSKLWMQIHADVANLPIYIPKNPEASLVGSAIAAAVASGFYSNLREASNAMVHILDKIEPNPENHSLYQSYLEKYIELYWRLRDLVYELGQKG